MPSAQAIFAEMCIRDRILDEATAFADPDNEAKVQAAFAQLAKGKTVLMIAHRLSTVDVYKRQAMGRAQPVLGAARA